MTRGRVLRVKVGYNPNSSSLGTHIPAFLLAALSAGTLTVVALQAVAAAGGRIRAGGTEVPPEPGGQLPPGPPPGGGREGTG